MPFAPVCAGFVGAASRRGFTLVELIVAVAVVALLSLGIGQLFTNVQKLVGSGAAVAESDQFARALGAQLRDDFESLSQMSSADTFIAIRNRRVGDTNGDGDAEDAGERAVYLSADDRERDLRAGIAPYANGSRALTVRLDELMFLAPGKGGAAHTSAQTVSAGGGNLPTAAIARIYYGHGLRPVVDRSFDPLNPPPGATSNVPPRLWVADGDFAQRAGENNRFDPDDVANSGLVSGRNEYASQWVLLRQPMLLFGGTASGYPLGAGNSPESSPFDPQLSYTPYIRPLESHGDVRAYWGSAGWELSDDKPTPRPTNQTGPFPRLMRHGRVDVCAQSPEDVRRWLQGLAPLPESGLSTGDIDATAFSSGRLESLNQQRWEPGSERDTAPNDARADSPIFRRVNLADDQLAPLVNRRSIIGAIAGCFTRFLADTSAPLLDRRDTLSLDPSAAGIEPPPDSDPAASAFMDTHAVVGAHISSFEVAWTDGRTWEKDDPLDRNGNGEEDPTDPRRGDEIYYDIDFTRDSSDSGDGNNSLFAQANNGRLYGLVNPDLATASNPGIVREVAAFPEVPAEMRRDLTQGLKSSAARVPGPTGPGLGFGGYNPGDNNLPGANAGDPSEDGDNEYLAVFPYRWASGETDGEMDSRPAPKPKRIRIRVVVHDSQLRLSPGRLYEFIFPVNLREP